MSIYFTLAVAFFLSTGMKTGRVLITLYALRLGAQPFTVGVLVAVSEVLPTLLSWHVGRLSDRFGSRWLLMAGAAAGILGVLGAYLKPGLPSLFGTSVMLGLLSAGYGAPVQNLVGLQSGPKESARNFANFSLIASFGNFAGPLLAGFSIDKAGPGAACLTLVLLWLAPIVLLALWGHVLPRGTRTEKPVGGIGILLSEAGLWRVLATSSLVIAGVDLFQVFIPVYGHGSGLSASAIGIILAMNAAAAFVIRIFLPSLIQRFTVEKALVYSFLIGATGFLLVPLFQNVAILCLISFFFGLGMGCGQPITVMMTFTNSTPGRSGEAMGLRVTVNNITRMVSQVLFGSVGSVFGVFAVFWVNALILGSGAAISQPRASGGGRKEG